MMRKVTPTFAAFLVFDIVLLVVCLFHLTSVLDRPDSPFEVNASGDRVVITAITDSTSSGTLRFGDILLRWNTLDVSIPEEIEFLADLDVIGNTVAVTFERDGESRSTLIRLTPYYPSPRFLIISFVVGIIIWATGVFILWNAPPGLNATVLHWTMIAFGVTVLITLGPVSGGWLSYVTRFLFFVAYMGVVSLFCFFTFLFPKPLFPNRLLAALLTLLPALVLILGMSYFHLLDIQSRSLEHFQQFQAFFDAFHVSLFLYLGGAVFNIVHSFSTSKLREEKKQLQWLVWGLCIGSAPFLFLQILPQLLFSQYLIAEEYATIFFLVIPFSWSMSFLKYRFLDIEILINRSIVYSVLTIFIVLVFGLVFFLVTTAFGRQMAVAEYLIVAGVALLMAFLFVPVRDWLQRITDETLFTARVHFRSAVNSISEELHRSPTVDALFAGLAERLAAFVPSRCVSVYVFENSVFIRRTFRGEPMSDWIQVPRDVREILMHSPLLAAGGSSKLNSGEAERWLEQTGYALCRAMTDERGELRGALFLSPRTKADRFREEEIDLVSTLGAQAAEVLQRLYVQERMILEQAEKKRLNELSELKSYFVSSVSHELRMPLTSIRMFAETLRLGRVTQKRRRKEYLAIIEGESARLDRLIQNVLNFARIERGAKEYEFGPADIRRVTMNAVASLRYEYKAVRAKLETIIPKKLPTIHADADALEEVLINLLSNALKYSTMKKHIRLTVTAKPRFVQFEVADSGIGISAEELPNIFEKFYRVRDRRTQQVGGTGLGLPVVKHIVDAHGGAISVRSTPGKGSTFTVKIPIRHENNTSG